HQETGLPYRFFVFFDLEPEPLFVAGLVRYVTRRNPGLEAFRQVLRERRRRKQRAYDERAQRNRAHSPFVEGMSFNSVATAACAPSVSRSSPEPAPTTLNHTISPVRRSTNEANPYSAFVSMAAPAAAARIASAMRPPVACLSR